MSIISENIKLYNPFNNSYLLRSSFFHLLLLFYPVSLAVFYKADMVPGFSIHRAYILLSILCFCIYMIFLGETVSIIQLEILSKPLSFCLPHHDKISYKIILSTGILANIILCSIISSIFTSPPHNLFLPKGRSSQFRSKMGCWLMNPLLAAWCLKNLIPGFTLAGIYFQYNVPVLSLIVWQLVLIPVMDTFFYYFVNPCSIFTVILFVAILLVLFLFSFFTDNQTHRFLSMALAIFLANGFFIERLARYWFKRDISILN